MICAHCGSAARGRLRSTSDIDWVFVRESPPRVSDWPTSRHSFQTYAPDAFLRQLSEGHEFAVWQLAYGQLLAGSSVLDHLRRAQVAANTVGTRRKRRVLERRQRLIELLARAVRSRRFAGRFCCFFNNRSGSSSSRRGTSPAAGRKSRRV